MSSFRGNKFRIKFTSQIRRAKIDRLLTQDCPALFHLRSVPHEGLQFAYSVYKEVLYIGLRPFPHYNSQVFHLENNPSQKEALVYKEFLSN